MKEKATNTVHVERARHRLTQGQLASKTGCARQTIHSIETGKIEPGIKIALKIIRFLNKLKADAGMTLINVEDIFKLTKSN